MHPTLRAALLCLVPLPALLGTAACQNVTPAGTSFATEPPGARVHVDGRDSGWVTPCLIALDPEDTHKITLNLDGYEPREFVFVPETRRSIVEWKRGVNGVKSTIRFPILLPAEDLLFPVRESQALSPGRVFVRLRPIPTP